MKKTIIITGASEGIGSAMALEFARRGYALGLISRRMELLQKVKKDGLALGASQIHLESVDVTDEIHFESALSSLDQKLGGAEFFVANAGVTGRSSFDETAWPSAKKTLLVNAMAAIHGLEVMKVKMLARGRGTLVGVSSVAGSRGMPTGGAYSSSKAALTTHLETMRVDLKGMGISVVTIAPGFIDTSLTKKNKGKMPFLMQPEDAARIFATAIEKKKVWAIAPRPYFFLYPILQMLPRAWFDFILSRTYRSIRG
ncbi:MAG: SDR family NAD(P)-dependent oxidoreductase [Bdellovibrionales bacterium]|nr:SDR family NAD(P)-dependent oxidoreductase [Bdellovibrionales bacterium]